MTVAFYLFAQQPPGPGGLRMELLLFLMLVVIPMLMLAFSGFVGKWNEKRHLKSLAEREARYAGIFVTDLKRLPGNWKPVRGEMVVGHMVLGNDRFNRFLGLLINITGGNIQPFERLLDRARREAIVRMLEQAHALRADVIWNVRINTTMIDPDEKNKTGKAIEALAWGTAMLLSSEKSGR
jgi:uncharacterized protein YbjQ (UPF0145 family)